MTLSPVAAATISLVLAIIMIAVPAIDAGLSPPGWMMAVGLPAGGPVFKDDSASPPARVTVIDESFNGNTVRVARGDILLVQLPEREPDRTWQFDGGSAFKVASDTVLEMYPARHDFRVKVLGPGDLHFKKVDNRDGMTVDTFSVTVVIKKGTSEKDSSTAFPMWHINMLRPGTNFLPF